MAEGGSRTRHDAGGGPLPPTLELTAEDILHQPLPDSLPAEMFTGPGLLALADLLPVMTAYVDRDEVYRFVNKPYSEWIGLPRKQMLGMTMRELLGDKNYADRKAMIDSALAGERQFFAATYDHPERGTLALQID
jgi:PAS domain-containing protein